MVTKINDKPTIFQIHIPLPDNPLKNLNCYVLQSKGETLIIDTGFNRPECKQAMEEGLSELGVDFCHTSLFLTHLHSDHTGLVYNLMQGKNCPIYMGKTDYDYFVDTTVGDTWIQTEHRFEQEGFPKEYTTALRNTNPARSFAPSGVFPAIMMYDGDTLQIGDYTLKTILVPGHTPGQMCLYIEKEQILFTADHILFDITPNITSWIGVKDSLGDYIQSLYKIKKIPIQLALPAHRKNHMNVYERIDQIIEHHKIRLENTIDILAQNQPLTAYETASFMKWSMRGKCWEDFPITQRWFAVGETMAHLDYLLVRGLAQKIPGVVFKYRLLYSAENCKKRIDLSEKI